MDNFIINTIIIIFLWILTFYFTIYCLKVYIDSSNIFYACFLHLLLIVLIIYGYPSPS